MYAPSNPRKAKRSELEASTTKMIDAHPGIVIPKKYKTAEQTASPKKINADINPTKLAISKGLFEKVIAESIAKLIIFLTGYLVLPANLTSLMILMVAVLNPR